MNASTSEQEIQAEHALAHELRTNYDHICASVDHACTRFGRQASSVRVIAVSKTQPLPVMKAALLGGIWLFGENYAQELKEKAAALLEESNTVHNTPQCEWHFIGHLQTNKVKMIAPYATCIHSVDSVRLATEIAKAALNGGRCIDIMLQVNTSGEDSKSGCESHEIYALAESVLNIAAQHSSIRIRGLMTIAAFADDAEIVRPMFRLLRSLRDELRERFPEAAQSGTFDELSMGMSGDYEAAIEEGATMVRVGTAIFGARQYTTKL
jgi:PLP dependent protein